MTFRSFSERSRSRFSAQKEEKLHDEKMASANAKIKQAGEYNTIITLFLLLIAVKVKHMRRSRKRKPPMSAKSMLATSTLSTHWVPEYHRKNSTWVYSKYPGSTQAHSQQPHVECYPTPYRDNLQYSCLPCSPCGY